MALPGKILDLLNRSPALIAIEQLRKVYLRVYPYMVLDFVHKGDLAIAFASVQAELEQIKTLLRLHTHVSAAPGSPVTPTAIPVPPVTPSVMPYDTVGLSFIVPGGVPQPTGGGISLQPSRLDPIPIAVPPINPLDPSL